MVRTLAVVAALAALAGCSDKKKAEGLPPAQEWGASAGGPMAPAGPAGSPHSAAPRTNPHAGVPGAPDLSDTPEGGGADPANPHAGVDMGGGGTDVAKMGLPAPDPSRPIDPAHHVKGVIKLHPKTKDHASPGGAIFVVVKQADAGGQPSGPPLAVEKLTWQKDELAFELTEAQAMIGGTQLVGDVVVTARYDQDGDAISKQPGDLVGQVRVKVPDDHVILVLDQILP